MRKLPLMTVVMLLLSPAAQAQVQLDVSNMLRSLSGSLRGKDAQAPKQDGVTPVMGVRGIDEPGQQAASAPVGEDFVLMEGWAATRPEATATASQKGLVARQVSLKEGTNPAGSKQ